MLDEMQKDIIKWNDKICHGFCSIEKGLDFNGLLLKVNF